VGKDGGAVKRKREEGKPSGKQPKVSKEEAEAQAKRAAARARVEARTMKSFGLQ
jgi:WW domain-binding protein 4